MSRVTTDSHTNSASEMPVKTLSDRAVLLEARHMFKNFGGVGAVNNVSLQVYPGEVQALIGPNGAGKTTTFNLISGVYFLDGGEIIFAGKRISGQPVHRIAAMGMSRTFQNLQIFHNMTALENVMVGCYLQSRVGFLSAAVRWPGIARKEQRLQAEAHRYLAMVGLDNLGACPAASLSYGQQRLVEIARALAVGPKLLLLDEPAAGLTQPETEALSQLIYRIRDQGITVLLVEHDMNLVMEIADRVVVLHYGQKIAEGRPEEIQSNSAVIQAYLGTDWGIV